MKDYTEKELEEMAATHWLRRVNDSLNRIEAAVMFGLVVVVCIFIMLIWKG